MLRPGGLVGGFTVRLPLFSGGLHALEMPERTERLARHADGLGAAFHGPFRRGLGSHGGADAVLRLLGVHNEEGGEIGFGGVGGAERGDLGDGGKIAAGQIIGAVGVRGREGEGEAVGEVVVGVRRELGGEGFGVWFDVGHVSYYGRYHR